MEIDLKTSWYQLTNTLVFFYISIGTKSKIHIMRNHLNRLNWKTNNFRYFYLMNISILKPVTKNTVCSKLPGLPRTWQEATAYFRTLYTHDDSWCTFVLHAVGDGVTSCSLHAVADALWCTFQAFRCTYIIVCHDLFYFSLLLLLFFNI